MFYKSCTTYTHITMYENTYLASFSLALSIIFVNFIDQKKWLHADSICIILITGKIEHFSNVY